ncbi:ATP-binding protein [Yinghuangia soli]|uniref:ATP-binding protein n=1 Tax=Yinghuangia soli TaxID=2908204 RepID=A0AA41U2I2_9ACTN|nr:ATP-binding protein [Yinghuangia soli]MCF2528662.1 ATP-binding protein [Yinghuangia soli]
MFRRDDVPASVPAPAPGQHPEFSISALPKEIPDVDAALFRVRLFQLLGALVDKFQPPPFAFGIGYGRPPVPAPLAPPAIPGGALSPAHTRESGLRHGSDRPDSSGSADSSDESAEKGRRRPLDVTAIAPLYRFDQLVLPGDTLGRLLDCVSFVEVAPLVFDAWNLRAIEPSPSVAVNFKGPPGTGKTMAAHAVAHRLDRRLLSCRLSDLESKYHGEGPKNVAALFELAREQDAVLFIDEAESLLSGRFARPQQAAESAINSMRTELLMALDSFTGLVIFASNLPHSYDAAIESRLLHVDFALPDQPARARLWEAHLPAELPLCDDVSPDALAEISGVTGRDIKTAVILAAIRTARSGLPAVSHEFLESALLGQRDGGGSGTAASGALATSDGELDEAGKAAIGERLRALRGGSAPVGAGRAAEDEGCQGEAGDGAQALGGDEARH